MHFTALIMVVDLVAGTIKVNANFTIFPIPYTLTTWAAR